MVVHALTVQTVSISGVFKYKWNIYHIPSTRLQVPLLREARERLLTARGQRTLGKNGYKINKLASKTESIFSSEDPLFDFGKL